VMSLLALTMIAIAHRAQGAFKFANQNFVGEGEGRYKGTDSVHIFSDMEKMKFRSDFRQQRKKGVSSLTNGAAYNLTGGIFIDVQNKQYTIHFRRDWVDKHGRDAIYSVCYTVELPNEINNVRKCVQTVEERIDQYLNLPNVKTITAEGEMYDLAVNRSPKKWERDSIAHRGNRADDMIWQVAPESFALKKVKREARGAAIPIVFSDPRSIDPRSIGSVPPEEVFGVPSEWGGCSSPLAPPVVNEKAEDDWQLNLFYMVAFPEPIMECLGLHAEPAPDSSEIVLV